MKRILLVLALLAATAHANPLAPGVALPPGDAEAAVEAARPQQPAQGTRPIAYAADLAPMVRAPFVADASPPAPLTEAERVAIAVRAAQAGLVAAQQGIQGAPVLKSWSETRAGQVVLGCIAGAIVVTSAAGAVAGVWVAAR